MIFILPIAIITGIVAWFLRPKKGTSRVRGMAVVVTVVVSLIVFFAALASQLLYSTSGHDGVSGVANDCFLVSLALVGAMIVALVVFLITRKVEIAEGTGFGLAISIFLTILELGLLEWLGGV